MPKSQDPDKASVSSMPMPSNERTPLVSRSDAGRADMKRPPAPSVPQCWASAEYPENTIESFRVAIRDGADGIESDVHVTKDNVVVMFHDPQLERTTNGTGKIKDHNYYGELDKLLTTKQPVQKIPTFAETIELLMQPANQHVILNIDVKMDNDPVLLFTLLHEVISSHDGYATLLGPRLILGLWHPNFLKPAKEILPYLRLTHIGASLSIARRYFWTDCGGFSLLFPVLVGSDGRRFREECKAAGKDFYVWTVNERPRMIEAAKWGAKAILTDKPAELLSLRAEMEEDWPKVAKETSWTFGWSSIWYTRLASVIWVFWQFLITRLAYMLIKKRGGPITVEAQS